MTHRTHSRSILTRGGQLGAIGLAGVLGLALTGPLASAFADRTDATANGQDTSTATVAYKEVYLNTADGLVALGVDTDHDGYSDELEEFRGSDPNDAASVPPEIQDVLPESPQLARDAVEAAAAEMQATLNAEQQAMLAKAVNLSLDATIKDPVTGKAMTRRDVFGQLSAQLTSFGGTAPSSNALVDPVTGAPLTPAPNGGVTGKASPQTNIDPSLVDQIAWVGKGEQHGECTSGCGRITEESRNGNTWIFEDGKWTKYGPNDFFPPPPKAKKGKDGGTDELTNPDDTGSDLPPGAHLVTGGGKADVAGTPTGPSSDMAKVISAPTGSTAPPPQACRIDACKLNKDAVQVPDQATLDAIRGRDYADPVEDPVDQGPLGPPRQLPAPTDGCRDVSGNPCG